MIGAATTPSIADHDGHIGSCRRQVGGRL